jgi:glycosyltransferase involved in cell wall biosynthesis
MKILFVIDSLLGGGAEKVLTDIVKNLDKSKYQVTVLTIHNRGIYIDEIKEFSNYKYVFNNNLKNNKILQIYYRLLIKIATFLPPKIIYKWFVRGKYDVEIAFLEGLSTKTIAGSTNNTSRKYAWIHTNVITHQWYANIFRNNQEEEECYKKFNQILCVSNSVKAAFEEKFKLIDNVKVQYNVVNEIAVRNLAIQSVDDIEISSKFKIVSIGSLSPQKGFDRLLRSFSKLISTGGFDCELWILGEGPERSNLEKSIYENNLNESVKLLGFKSNPYKYLAKCDLFVCSSYTEGFSTVTTEAIILGIPVVTTNCAGMHELLNDSEYGLITENSEEGLSNGLFNVLSNKEIYLHYKSKAIERSNDFKIKNRITEIENLLNIKYS